jgi:hypothetical protein
MKTKFNPAYILLMLQDIKKMSNENCFDSVTFLIKYPSFKTFKKILISKGLFESKSGVEKWIGVEPNLIMAKEVFRIYLENKKQNAENKKMDSITKEEYEIDSNKMPYIESLEKENSELKLKKLQDLKEIEIKDKKISKLQQINAETKNANASLVKQLGEIQNHQFFDRGNLTENNIYLNQLTNDLRNANIKLKNELDNKKSKINVLKNELQIKCDLLEELQVSSVSIQDLSNLNKTIYEQKQKILNLDKTLLEKDLIIENLKSISIDKSPNVTKKIRIFGIPIYTSETK